MSTQLTTQVQEPKTKLDRFKAAMNSADMSELIGNSVKENKDAFIVSLVDLVSSDGKLSLCDPKDLIKAAIKAATLKLPVNKSLGRAWIIPYKKSRKNSEGKWEDYYVPEFQMGYKGLVELGMKSGYYRFINTREVREGQLVSDNFLTGEYIFQHAKKSDTIIGYMAHFELMNGSSKTLYTTKEEIIDHAKKYSKSYDPSKKDNIWVVEFDSMALKTVLRELLDKWGVLSMEMHTAFASDKEADQKTFINAEGKVTVGNANTDAAGFDDFSEEDSKIKTDPENTESGDQAQEENNGDQPDF